ncbi:GNAT family N-acetyltransferase [Lolliginicoccus suaedae]|uniref:GNAT family N-acetyltransferase n=1 Tax=Lolliginicoccus suaedae TaxID=2605429 RepID=UPI0011ED6CC5|nr:GNAT family N-acetyltransferase [Lolliginicoccus suaedae]
MRPGAQPPGERNPREQHPHTLRPIDPGDYAAVSGLTVAAYAPYIPAGSEYLDLLADVEARAAAAEIVVAEIAGAVVGAIVLADAGSALAEIAREGELEFRMIAVAEQARGSGVGTALVRHGIAEARRRGNEAVVLSSMRAMIEARRIYARHGFVEVPERKQYRSIDVFRLVL